MGASQVFAAMRRWRRASNSTSSSQPSSNTSNSPIDPPPGNDLPQQKPSLRSSLAAPRTRNSTSSTSIPRSSFDKPLPLQPRELKKSLPDKSQPDKGPPDLPIARQFASKQPKKPTPEPISLDGSQIKESTMQTDVTVTHASPVIHETVEPQHHEDVQQVITREIHNHHVIHRVLPIKDVQVLPAKHYAPAGPSGTLVEIDPPAGSAGHGWTIVSNQPDQDVLAEPYPWKRNVVKRDETSHLDADGVKRTETTWFHPAHLEEGAMLTAQTTPFNFGLSRDESDSTFVTACEPADVVDQLVDQSRINREAEEAVRQSHAQRNMQTMTLPVRLATTAA